MLFVQVLNLGAHFMGDSDNSFFMASWYKPNSATNSSLHPVCLLDHPGGVNTMNGAVEFIPMFI